MDGKKCSPQVADEGETTTLEDLVYLTLFQSYKPKQGGKPELTEAETAEVELRWWSLEEKEISDAKIAKLLIIILVNRLANIVE